MPLKFAAAFIIVVLTASAQDQNFFPKPSYFRETFTTPKAQIEMMPPVRLADFVVDGKLELSLRSYIELVMANNTEVAISRLAVDTAKNAILRGFAPFDPLATANFNNTRTKTPSTSALDAATTLATLSQPVNFNYSQTMQNGTQYQVGFSEIKSSTNSGFSNVQSRLQLRSVGQLYAAAAPKPRRLHQQAADHGGAEPSSQIRVRSESKYHHSAQHRRAGLLAGGSASREPACPGKRSRPGRQIPQALAAGAGAGAPFPSSISISPSCNSFRLRPRSPRPVTRCCSRMRRCAGRWAPTSSRISGNSPSCSPRRPLPRPIRACWMVKPWWKRGSHCGRT